MRGVERRALHLVARLVEVEDGHGRRGGGHTEQTAGEAEHVRAGEGGCERDGRVDVDGACADVRLDRDVLDLLVDDREDEDEQAGDRFVARRADEDGQDDRDVRADVGHELRDDARPQPERQPVRHADEHHERAVNRRRDRREDEARRDVPADLCDEHLPHRQHDALLTRREQPCHPGAQTR